MKKYKENQISSGKYQFYRQFILVAVVFFLVPLNISNAQSGTSKNEELPQAELAVGSSDTPKISRLRFVTDNDYPPFNYLDKQGNLVGFNVELAQAICAELKVSCSMQALKWDRMIASLDAGGADAVIASLAITKRNRRRVAFSRPYYRTPARFVTGKDVEFKNMYPETLQGKNIGVAKGTSHEAYLKAFYGTSNITSFKNSNLARQALADEMVDAVFGDGVSLMFWLRSAVSAGCCKFSGGAYTESKFFGQGVGIAVKRDNKPLVKMLNQGLDLVQKSGRYQQLYKRFFPSSFY